MLIIGITGFQTAVKYVLWKINKQKLFFVVVSAFQLCHCGRMNCRLEFKVDFAFDKMNSNDNKRNNAVVMRYKNRIEYLNTRHFVGGVIIHPWNNAQCKTVLLWLNRLIDLTSCHYCSSILKNEKRIDMAHLNSGTPSNQIIHCQMQCKQFKWNWEFVINQAIVDIKSIKVKAIGHWRYKPRSPWSYSQFNNAPVCKSTAVRIYYFLCGSPSLDMEYGNIWNRSILMNGNGNNWSIWPTDDKVDGGNSAIVILKDLIRSMHENFFSFSTEK